ncbi:hypothetical protein [Maridesulfovibrio zosterae]|uniref:hypothetical protein n=1 Tax=Maridesulfovibrio zosterae TaxID=82171 RepID=UPI0003FBF4AF|nr:hypothetical protein [Maridesulfovibrio zosterae]
MAKITKMPGRTCRFYQNGKCFYEEELNPGYNINWRCNVLKGLEDEYDKLLHQAENFKLDEHAFSVLWEQRMEELLKSEVLCRKIVLDNEAEFPFCSAVYNEVCLYEIPECEGVCSRFKP